MSDCIINSRWKKKKESEWEKIRIEKNLVFFFFLKTTYPKRFIARTNFFLLFFFLLFFFLFLFFYLFFFFFAMFFNNLSTFNRDVGPLGVRLAMTTADIDDTRLPALGIDRALVLNISAFFSIIFLSFVPPLLAIFVKKKLNFRQKTKRTKKKVEYKK